MTPAQLDNARAVREELLLMFNIVGDQLKVEDALSVQCAQHGLPPLNGDLLAKLSAAWFAVSEAMDAYDVFLDTPSASLRTSPPAGERGDSPPLHLDDKPAGGVLAVAA